jgi:hypothetical protein
LVSGGQRLFLFGGRGDEILGDLWSYDVATGTWTEVTASPAPSARFGHNAAFDAARGRLLLFGGQS